MNAPAVGAAPALLVSNLVKVYDGTKDSGAKPAAGAGAVRALDGLSFSIAPGETVALLGPNGAGKTTAIRTIATLVRPTSGSVAIGGIDVVGDPDGARLLLGYVPQEIALDRLLTVREHLELAGRLHRMSGASARARADEVLKLVRLEDKADTRSKKLSGGMKKRLDLGMGLVHRPRLLVLDEPTVGLDLDARAAVWDFLQALKAGGTATLLSTHSMEEAARLADRVAVMSKGRVVKIGKTDDLVAELEGDVLEVRLEGKLPEDALLEAARQVAGARSVSRTRDGFEVVTDKDPKVMAGLASLLAEQKLSIGTMTYRRPTLEDVFRRAVGKSFAEEEGR